MDKLEGRWLHGLIAGLAAIAVIAFVAGSFFGSDLIGASSDGDETSIDNVGIGEKVSENEIKQSAQEFMDLQLGQTRQQLAIMVMQDENLSENDVYIETTLGEVSSSEFDSLYKVPVAITGILPSQTGGGFDNIDEEQDLFVSLDGRYVFQQPVDLENIPQ